MKDDNTNDILFYMLLFGLLDGFDLTAGMDEALLTECVSDQLETCDDHLFFEEDW
jgi:hypothetical protein